MSGDGVGEFSPQELVARTSAGRYQPLSFCGQGGQALVFVAEDGELGRSVALKCLQALAATDSEARQRFLLEAEITSKLEHPGIIPIYGLGRDERGRPYYAMRLIRGNSLAQAAEEFHRSPPTESPERHVEFRRLLRSLVTVCETMAYAHARGVIHRDLKPSNIMLGPYGETLVVDWGLAKRLNQPDAESSARAEPLQLHHDGAHTVAGRYNGSPAFMSPEQARGDLEQVGPGSDVYSLGATLYVLLTGKTPYQGGLSRVIEQVKTGQFPPPRQVNRTVPAALDAICRRAMAARASERYASARELAGDLERWLADEPVGAWREPLRLRTWRWLKRHRTLVAATIASLLVAAILLSVYSARLNTKNHQLDQQNVQLVELNAKEVQARSAAEQHLARNLAQLEGMLRFAFLSKRMQNVRRDPGYFALLDQIAAQADQLAADVPDEARGRRVGALAHYLRAAGDSTPALPANLETHLQKATTGFEGLRSLDLPFAIWGVGASRAEYSRRLTEAGRFEQARTEALAAFDLLAEHQPVEGRTGRSPFAGAGGYRHGLV